MQEEKTNNIHDDSYGTLSTTTLAEARTKKPSQLREIILNSPPSHEFLDKPLPIPKKTYWDNIMATLNYPSIHCNLSSFFCCRSKKPVDDNDDIEMQYRRRK